MFVCVCACVCLRVCVCLCVVRPVTHVKCPGTVSVCVCVRCGRAAICAHKFAYWGEIQHNDVDDGDTVYCVYGGA